MGRLLPLRLLLLPLRLPLLPPRLPTKKNARMIVPFCSKELQVELVIGLGNIKTESTKFAPKPTMGNWYLNLALRPAANVPSNARTIVPSFTITKDLVIGLGNNKTESTKFAPKPTMGNWYLKPAL